MVKHVETCSNEKRKTRRSTRSVSISEVQYVVIDTELTGLDEKKDSIVSIGAVRMTGGRIELGNTFYRLVSPRTELKASSVVIHEITPSEVAAKPRDRYGARANSSIFAAMRYWSGISSRIDLGFLNREMKRIRGRKLPNPAIDTFSIYEWLRKRNKSRDCFASAACGIPALRHREMLRHPGQRRAQCAHGCFYHGPAASEISPAVDGGGSRGHRGSAYE